MVFHPFKLFLYLPPSPVKNTIISSPYTFSTQKTIIGENLSTKRSAFVWKKVGRHFQAVLPTHKLCTGSLHHGVAPTNHSKLEKLPCSVFTLKMTESQWSTRWVYHATLDKLIDYICDEEAGTAEASDLVSDAGLVGALHRKSSYNQQKQQIYTCRHYGQAKHSPTNSPEDRKKHCQAWGKTCSKCQKMNHVPKVCNSSKAASIEVTETEAFDATAAGCSFQQHPQISPPFSHTCVPVCDRWLRCRCPTMRPWHDAGKVML